MAPTHTSSCCAGPHQQAFVQVTFVTATMVVPVQSPVRGEGKRQRCQPAPGECMLPLCTLSARVEPARQAKFSEMTIKAGSQVTEKSIVGDGNWLLGSWRDTSDRCLELWQVTRAACRSSAATRCTESCAPSCDGP